MYSLLFVFAFLLLGTAAFAGFRGAPWLPTRTQEIAQAISSIERSSPATLVDLGCGTGSLLFAYAKKHPSTQLYGYEISLGPFLFAYFRKLLFFTSYRNVHLFWKNLYRADVSSADAIFIFMMQGPHTRIAQRVLCRAQHSAHIFFQAWPPENFVPHARIQEHHCLPLYQYFGKDFHIPSQSS